MDGLNDWIDPDGPDDWEPEADADRVRVAPAVQAERDLGRKAILQSEVDNPEFDGQSAAAANELAVDEKQRPTAALDAMLGTQISPPFDPEGTGYDKAGAIAAGLKPDETGHWPSRDPKTGTILKGRKHETWPLTEKGEADAGMAITKDADGRYRSRKVLHAPEVEVIAGQAPGASQGDVRRFDQETNEGGPDMADAFAEALTGATTPGSFGEMARVLTSGDPRSGFMRGSVMPGDIPNLPPAAPGKSAPVLSQQSTGKGPFVPMRLGTPSLFDFKTPAGSGAQTLDEVAGSIRDVFDSGEFKARWQRTLGGLSAWRAGVNADPDAAKFGLVTDWQAGAEKAIDEASRKLFETRRLNQDPAIRFAVDAALNVMEQGPAMFAAAAAARIGAPGLFVDLVGLGPMALQSYGNAYARYGQYANSPGERARLALADAFIEVAPEKLALDQYLRLAGSHGADMITRELAKTVTVETGEEWTSDVLHFMQDQATIDPNKNLGGLLQDMIDSAKGVALAVPGLSLFGKAGHAAGGAVLGKQGQAAQEFERMVNETDLPPVDINNLDMTEGVRNEQTVPSPGTTGQDQRGQRPRGDDEPAEGGQPPPGDGGQAAPGDQAVDGAGASDWTLPDGQVEPTLPTESEGVATDGTESPEPILDEATLRGLMPGPQGPDPTLGDVSHETQRPEPTLPDTGPEGPAPDPHTEAEIRRREEDERSWGEPDLPEDSEPKPTIRTMTPEIRAELIRMGEAAGWQEIGGKMIRTPDPDDPTKDKISLTKWIPKEDWYQGRVGGYNEEETRKLVVKALAGKPLTPKQTKAIDYMIEKAAEHLSVTKDFEQLDIPKEADNWDNTQLTAAAQAFDPDIIERLSIEHEDDTAYWAALREWVNDKIAGQDHRGGQETGGQAGEEEGPDEAQARQKVEGYTNEPESDFELSPSPGPPSDGAKKRKGKPPVSRLSSGQLDIFTQRDEPATGRAAAKFAVETRAVRLGTFRTGVKQVKSVEDAGHIFAGLRKEPIEHGLTLVLDKNHRPLAMIRSGLGARTETNIYPAVMAQAVHSIPGARWIVFAHNHPSGEPIPSSADIRLVAYIAETLKGTGVELYGNIIIAGQKVRGFEGPLNWEGTRDIKPAARTDEIPEMGFRYFKQGKLSVTSLSSPAEARKFIESMDGEGIVLMDAQNRPVAWYPIAAKELEKLRTGDTETGSGPLFRVFQKAAAGATMLKMAKKNDEAARNFARFAKANDARLLDAFYPHPNTVSGLVSMQETGGIEAHGEFRTKADEYPIYYSQLVRSVGALKQEKMPAAQWLGTIENMTKSGAAKREEIFESGVVEWLKLQEGATLTKRQVLGFLGGMDDFVQNDQLGGIGGNMPTDPIRASVDRRDTIVVALDALGYNVSIDHVDDGGNGNIFAVTDRGADIEYNHPVEGDQTDGRVFADLPIEARTLVNEYNELIADDEDYQDGQEGDDGSRGSRYGNTAYVLPGGAEHVELVVSVAGGIPWLAGDRAHFADLSGGRVAVWVRGNTRIDTDGKRVFHIEEIQSKRGEEGKKLGFVDPARAREIAEIEEKIRLLRVNGTTDAQRREYFTPGRLVRGYGGWDKVIAYHEGRDGAPYPENRWRVTVVEVKRDGSAVRNAETRTHTTDPADAIITELYSQIPGGRAQPPSMAFTGTTKAWVTLGLKRALRYAAQHEFDKVSWAPGEHQVKRYRLSEHITAIVYSKNPARPAHMTSTGIADKESWNVAVIPKGASRTHTIEHAAEADRLRDIFGEEMAQRIVNGEGLSNGGGVFEINDVDMKIGGKGMIEFYDKILPNIVNDVIGKLGGGRVGTVSLPSVKGPELNKTDIANAAVKYMTGDISFDEFAEQSGLEGLVTEEETDEALEGSRDPHDFERHRRIAQNYAVHITTSKGGQKRSKLPGFDITPELRANVMKGLPQFTSADQADTDLDVPVTTSEPDPVFKRRLGKPRMGDTGADYTVEQVIITTPAGREYSDAYNDVTTGMPQAALKSLAGFIVHVQDGHDTGGMFFPRPQGGNGVISLSQWHLELATAEGAPKSREWVRRKLRGWLAHELTHAFDAGMQPKTTGNSVDQYASADSPRLGFDYAGLYARPELQGDLFREAWDLFGQVSEGSRPLREALKYPFINLIKGSMGDKAVRVELFAQMGRFYFTSRRMMQEHLPLWYAAFEEIFANASEIKSVDGLRDRIRESLSGRAAGRAARVRGADRAAADRSDGRGGQDGGIPGGVGDGTVAVGGDGLRVKAEDEMRPDAIRDYVRQAFGVPVSEGLMGRSKKKIGGFWRPNYKTIHLANRNNLGVLAHEVGHHLSGKGYRKIRPTELGFRGVMRAFPAELLNPAGPFAHSGYANASKIIRLEEGFAEFIRFYITDRARAQAGAPVFFRQFETFLAANPQFKVPVEEFTRRLAANRAAPAEDRILAKMGKPSPTLKETLSGKVNKKARDAIVYQTLDRWKPLNRVVEDLQPGILPSKNPYIAARLLAGDSAMVEDWLTRWTIPFDTAKRLNKANFGKSLMEILEPVLDDEKVGKKFTAYIIARRASELRADHREKLYDADEIADGLALGTPEFEAVAEELYQYSDRLLQYRIDAGILTEELADRFREFENYLPFFRVADGFQSDEPASSHGIKIHRLKGGTANIRDVIENVILNTSRTIRAANRNHVVQLLAQLVRSVPGSGVFAEEIPVPQTVLSMATDKIIEQLELQGVTIDVSTATNLAAQQMFFQKNPVNDERKGVFIFMEGGKYKALQINDAQLWDALNRMEPQEIGLLTSMFSFPARMARAGIVLAPEFFVSNFFRDTLSATVQAKSRFFPVVSSLAGVGKGLEVRAGNKILKQMADSAIYYRALGGAYADMWSNDTEEMKGALERMARHSAIDKALILSPAGIIRLLERVGGAVEIGARITEFEGVTKKMIDAGMDPVDAAIAATFAGREVSTDFAQHGANQTLRLIARTTMFLNPAMQGLRKTAKVAAGAEGRDSQLKAAMVGGTMMLTSLLLYLSNRGEDWYKDIEDWERNTYWHFRVGGQTYRIPKPFEYGLFFASIPEALMEYYIAKHGQELRDRVAQGLGMVLGFRVVPHVPSVLMQWAYNYDDFAGRPIVPDSQERLEPELQAGPRTSLSARVLAKGTARVAEKLEGAGMQGLADTVKTSPAKTDFVVRQLFGGLGQYVLMAADQTLRLVGDYPAQPTPHWQEWPVVRKFVRNPDAPQSRDLNRFYKELETIRRQASSIKQMNDEQADRYEKLHGATLDRKSEAEGTAKRLSKARKEGREIFEDRSMTGPQKREELDTIYKGMRQEARDYIEER